MGHSRGGDGAHLQHPCIRDVAVLGIPNEEWGERLLAVVVAGEGFDVEEVAAWTRKAGEGEAAAAVKGGGDDSSQPYGEDPEGEASGAARDAMNGGSHRRFRSVAVLAPEDLSGHFVSRMAAKGRRRHSVFSDCVLGGGVIIS